MRAPIVALLVSLAMTAASAQQQRPAGSNGPAAAVPEPSAADAATIAEVLAFERQMEAAVVKGDVKFLASIIPNDFRFTHGDGWVAGGQPLRVDTKETWLASVEKKPYLNRDLGPVAVELHGDIALTYGRYTMHQTSSPSVETSVWFERVYAKRNGRWMYLSHRTVHGPTREEPQKTTTK
jgi:hypothetical protein